LPVVKFPLRDSRASIYITPGARVPKSAGYVLGPSKVRRACVVKGPTERTGRTREVMHLERIVYEEWDEMKSHTDNDPSLAPLVDNAPRVDRRSTITSHTPSAATAVVMARGESEYETTGDSMPDLLGLS
jgi:hypothetical protein